MKFEETEGYTIISEWFKKQKRKPFTFQESTWRRYHTGHSGMVIAPTGFGKTFSVFIAVLIDFMNNPKNYNDGLKLIWITPLRSLSKDLARAMQIAIDDIGLDWVVEVRNGDTDIKTKQRQTKKMPDVLLLTPESLHLLIAQKSREAFFKNLHCVVVDEWHELLSTKRGVMVELALAFLKEVNPKLKTWGITATIGNIDQAMEVLLNHQRKKTKILAKEKKQIEILSVFPENVEILPWAGHLGSQLAHQVADIILQHQSVIIFTNTRNQSEMWYQLLLDAYPDFAGQIALHHSSVDAHIRQWIEDALSNGSLKAVVSTSSLDLGVDFKPVDTIIQIGSSKGVARFIQRAGRSGHSPYEVSKIYFVPTHSLELVEVAALKEAVATQTIEAREPLFLTFDVLVQFMVTVAIGGGFDESQLKKIVSNTYTLSMITQEEWKWCLQFITVGGNIGKHYEEFHKVILNEEGKYVVQNRRIAMLHRMNLGVIVSEAMLKVKFISGGYIGMVEEYFISKIKPGEKFILAGRVLELVRIKDMIVQVKNSHGKAITPSWLGGRLPLTSNLGYFLRKKLAESDKKSTIPELQFLSPLITHQKQKSHLPSENEFLIESIKTREGYHLFFYPFEGRLVHEVMASLIAYRISKLYPISFSMAMNDYGFELFSDNQIKISDTELRYILSKENLMNDLMASINAAEMAKRKFRDIGVISGMLIQNLYGKQRNNKSLQSSSGIIFQVLEEHEPENLLIRQAYMEVFNQQLEEPRLRAAFDRIEKSTLVFIESDVYTPLSFPIKVDSLRQSLSSEELSTRIKKLQERSLKKKQSKRK